MFSLCAQPVSTGVDEEHRARIPLSDHCWIVCFLSGMVPFCFVRFGSVRFGSVRFGSVRFGSVRFGSVGFSMVDFLTPLGVECPPRPALPIPPRVLSLFRGSGTYVMIPCNSFHSFSGSWESVRICVLRNVRC